MRFALVQRLRVPWGLLFTLDPVNPPETLTLWHRRGLWAGSSRILEQQTQPPPS